MNVLVADALEQAIRNLDNRLRDVANRENKPSSSSKWWVEVRPDNDNLTDQTVELQAAILLASACGGTVVIGPGVLLAAGVVLHSNVYIQGAGPGATTVKTPNGANLDTFISYNFATLTGTNSTGGISKWAISALTIDGNLANNLVSGCGLRIYGYDYKLNDVHIDFCREYGIYSEWSTDPAAPVGSTGMAAYWYMVRVHQCEGGGVDWWGPHDSKWTDVEIWECGVGSTGLWTHPSGNSLTCSQVHVWGLNHTHSGQFDGNVMLSNCQMEGASDTQIVLGAAGCSIVGGQHFGAPGVPSYGIQIGRAGTPVGAYQIDTRVLNCTLGAINFVDDGGAGAAVRLEVYQVTPGVSAVDGTPSAATYRNIRVAGGADGAHIYVPDGGMSVGGQVVFRDSALGEAFVIQGNAGDIFSVNQTADFINIDNGAKLRGYSDHLTTNTWQLDGATGIASFLKTVINGAGLTDALAVNDGTGDVFNVSASGKQLSLVRAAALVGYSDSYSTQTWAVDANGHADFSVSGLRTKHVSGLTPTGGNSGDILVGNGKIWVNDAGTWKSAAV